MTSKPIQIVVTPGSGEGRALQTARRLRRRLAGRGRTAVIRSFDDLAALTQWAETCEPDFSRLVCIGGDGTLSAAARAAMRHDVPFVPVPNGFGNIFASVFGHPKRARDVAALLETGEVRRVDVGLARNGPVEEVFLSHRSFGVLEQIQQVASSRRIASCAISGTGASRTSSCSARAWRASRWRSTARRSRTTRCW
jgi:diacylglycerol kinase family enzyme